MSREVPYPLYYYYPPNTTFDVKGVFGGKFYANDNQRRSFNSNYVRQSEDFTWLFSTKYPGAPKWWRPVKIGTLYMGMVFNHGDAFKDTWEEFNDLDYIDANIMGSFYLDGNPFSWASGDYTGEYFPNYQGIGEDWGLHFSHPEVACHTHNFLDWVDFFMLCYIAKIYAIFFWIDWPFYLISQVVLRPRRRFDYEIYIDSSKRLNLGRDCGIIQEEVDEG